MRFRRRVKNPQPLLAETAAEENGGIPCRDVISIPPPPHDDFCDYSSLMWRVVVNTPQILGRSIYIEEGSVFGGGEMPAAEVPYGKGRLSLQRCAATPPNMFLPCPCSSLLSHCCVSLATGPLTLSLGYL